MKVGEAFVEIRPDTRGFQAEAERSIGGSFRKIAGIAAGAFAGAGVVKAIAGVIGGASDLNETISKSNTIFGKSGKAIEAWAGTAAKSMGQSKQQALEAAATFGNMFSQLGIGGEQTADMSQKMVQLATDFASFHNADITEVLQAQQAAFRGEYDAVQRFVPTITAAAVEQRALADTHKKTTKELTAQDKALATQKLLMEGAGAAVGDFARTSGGLANQQRILSAQFQNVKDKVGQALLPVITQVVSFINTSLIPGLGLIGQKLQPFIEQVKLVAGALAAAFSGEGVTSDGIVGTFERIGVALRQVYDFIAANFKPILIGLAAAFLAITSPVALVIAALVALYVRFESVRNAVAAFAERAVAAFGTVTAALQEHKPQIDAVLHALQALATWIGQNVVPILVRLGGVFVTLAATHIAALIGGVALLIQWFRNIVTAAQSVATGVSQKFSEVVAIVTGLPGKIKGAIGNLANLLYQAGRDVIQGFINGIKSLAGSLVKTITDTITAPINAAKRLLHLGSPSKLFEQFGIWVGEGLVRGITGMTAAVGAAATKMTAAALPAMPGFSPGGDDAISKYFAAVRQDGDYLNDWLSHVPASMKAAVEQAGINLAYATGGARGTYGAEAIAAAGLTDPWANGGVSGGMGGPMTVYLTLADGTIIANAIVDPMADALRRRDAALR